MVITSKKSNTVHFVYRIGGGVSKTLSVNPGANEVDPKVWKAVVSEMGSEKMASYSKFLTIEKEEKRK